MTYIFRNSTIYHHDSFSVSFVARETLIYMELFPHSHTIQQLLAMMRHNRSRKRSVLGLYIFSLLSVLSLLYNNAPITVVERSKAWTLAQAVSRRLPTAAARVQTRVWSCGILWLDKSGAGAGFLRELRFPLPVYIPSVSPQSSSLSPEAGTIGQEWPQCQ
jgi:hypothetical protein